MKALRWGVLGVLFCAVFSLAQAPSKHAKPLSQTDIVALVAD
jgi:hypothetical protein